MFLGLEELTNSGLVYTGSVIPGSLDKEIFGILNRYSPSPTILGFSILSITVFKVCSFPMFLIITGRFLYNQNKVDLCSIETSSHVSKCDLKKCSK